MELYQSKFRDYFDRIKHLVVEVSSVRDFFHVELIEALLRKKGKVVQ